jgi:hypothetical protein
MAAARYSTHENVTPGFISLKILYLNMTEDTLRSTGLSRRRTDKLAALLQWR